MRQTQKFSIMVQELHETHKQQVAQAQACKADWLP